MSAETAEMIQRVASEMGYEPYALARTPGAGPTGVLALALPYAAAFWDGNPFNHVVVQGAVEAAARRGYNLMLQSRQNHPWQGWDAAAVMDPGAEGVVVVAPAVGSPLLTALAQAGYPAVAAVCDPHRCPIACVNAADVEGARAAVTYLIRLGHRRIGYLMGSEDVATNHQRRDGYQAALAAAGLDRSDFLIASGSGDDQGGYRAAVQLLARRPRPTALLACNDLAARGAIAAARQMGLEVPRQLSVVGFDDTDFAARHDPPLTTVRYPAREIADQALECLVRLTRAVTYPPARGGHPTLRREARAPESLVLPTQLVVRESCAPPDPNTSP